MEMIYAGEFPFCDYGIDLEEMANQEKGYRVTRLTQKPSDTSMTVDKLNKKREHKKKEMGEWYRDKLRELPVRAHDKVPIDFVGKNYTGYMLYDIV
jgi:hypothetical protein